MLITFMHNKQAILWEEILTPFEGASADPGSLVESKQDFKPGSFRSSINFSPRFMTRIHKLFTKKNKNLDQTKLKAFCRRENEFG